MNTCETPLFQYDQSVVINTDYFNFVSFFRYGGTIYAFLFSSDIINNLMVAVLSKEIKQEFGYLGLFLIISAWGIVSLLATLLYPKNPKPEKYLKKMDSNYEDPVIEPVLKSPSKEDEAL